MGLDIRLRGLWELQLGVTIAITSVLIISFDKSDGFRILNVLKLDDGNCKGAQWRDLRSIYSTSIAWMFLLLLRVEDKLQGFYAGFCFDLGTLGVKNVVKAFEGLEVGDLIELHLDHCSDIKFIKHCIDCGFNSVMADFSNEPIELNIKKLNLIRDYLPKGLGQIEERLGPSVAKRMDSIVLHLEKRR